jgi:hypothetical protein
MLIYVNLIIRSIATHGFSECNLVS